MYDVHENALQVPRSAIVEDGGTRTSVFVVEEGSRPVRKTVTLGYGNRGHRRGNERALDEGENVVTVGQASLKQDSRK